MDIFNASDNRVNSEFAVNFEKAFLHFSESMVGYWSLAVEERGPSLFCGP